MSHRLVSSPASLWVDEGILVEKVSLASSIGRDSNELHSKRVGQLCAYAKAPDYHQLQNRTVAHSEHLVYS